MVSRAHTVAFLGVEARPIEVQCAITPGLPSFAVVGLPDKAVSESKERVRAALAAIGCAVPPQRIVINGDRKTPVGTKTRFSDRAIVHHHRY